jgi:hypothetical protein
MQLRIARLCLDCEELHSELHCPVCASDSFAYLSRWVPVEERRNMRRAPMPAAPTPAPQPRPGRWIARGAVGLAALATAQLLWRTRRPAGNGKVDEKAETDGPEIQNEDDTAI